MAVGKTFNTNWRPHKSHYGERRGAGWLKSSQIACQSFCWPENRTLSRDASDLLLSNCLPRYTKWLKISRYLSEIAFRYKFVHWTVGKGGLWVTSFIYKDETSTTYPLCETMPCFVLINKCCSWVQSALPTIRVCPVCPTFIQFFYPDGKK